MPPWLQFDRGKNERGEFLPEAKQYEEYARTLINLRMELIPYLYAAFHTYQQEGTPPFRPLLMDFPKDERLRTISDQYMIGDGLMAAPCMRIRKHGKSTSRKEPGITSIPTKSMKATVNMRLQPNSINCHSTYVREHCCLLPSLFPM